MTSSNSLFFVVDKRREKRGIDKPITPRPLSLFSALSPSFFFPGSHDDDVELLGADVQASPGEREA